MKKRGAIFYLYVVIAALFLFTAIQLRLPLTGQVIISVPVGTNCTTEFMEQVWDAVFIETSAGITVRNLENQGLCNFVAIKQKGNETFFIDYETTASKTNIEGIKAKFKQTTTEEVTSQIQADIFDKTSILALINTNNLQTRSIETESTANIHLTTIFDTDEKTLLESTNSVGETFYSNEESVSEKTNLSIAITKNYSLDTATITKEGGTCTPNWIETETPCAEDNRLLKYYIDENDCGDSSNKPNDETHYCDFDENGIIGNTTTIGHKNVNIKIKINDSELKEESTYTGEQVVEIIDENQTIVSFNWNFQAIPLNLDLVYIQKEVSNSPFGYIIANGIEAEKTFVLERKHATSDTACVLNKVIGDINQINTDCTGQEEYLLPCPGTLNQYSCITTGNKFIITGLTHSAVKEMLPQIQGATCTSNWQCTSWSSCLGGQQIRSCIDQNNCIAPTPKPEETRDCEGQCVPSWTCSDWSPEQCPQEGVQTRNCEDRNNCEGEVIPEERRSCTPASNAIWLYYLLIAIEISLIAIVIISIIQNIKHTKEIQETKKTTPIKPTIPGMQNLSAQQLNQKLQTSIPRMPETRTAIKPSPIKPKIPGIKPSPVKPNIPSKPIKPTSKTTNLQNKFPIR